VKREGFRLKSVKRLFIIGTIGLCAVALAQSIDKPAQRAGCLSPAAWHTLPAGKPRMTPASEIISEMAKRDVVLLGEQHDEPDHHYWQLQTLAALHALRPSMAIGFESFPRRVQPVLDSWIAGELTTRQFLEGVEWEKVWNFPPELYVPLFEFARVNRIPMIAINVERTLTKAVSDKGWDALPEAQKEGVSRPAAASSSYENVLFEVFAQHTQLPGRSGKRPGRDDPAFRNFVESQLTWDRAMAEALAARAQGDAASRPLVVGIMGGGHVRNGHGVPHQLRDLGVKNVGTLLPLDAATACSELQGGLADAVFALPRKARAKPPPPRLGVRLEPAEGGVRIASVTAGSLAETSGLQAGDHIVTVAGAPATVTSLIAAVRIQPAGTWLPVQVRRAQDTLDLVIKFPART
jgi:uncharacterized iron-regulated protein